MIRELLYKLYTEHRLLVGTGSMVVLYLAAVLVVIRSCKDKDHELPLLLCIPATIGCALARLIGACFPSEGKKAKKIGAVVFSVLLCILAVTISGKDVFSGEFRSRAENDMHIQTDLRDAADAILAESDLPSVLAMPGWDVYLLAYSSRFNMMYESPRSTDAVMTDEDEYTAYTELSKIHPDMRKVSKAAKRKDARYVMLSKGIWPEIPLEKCGYEPIFENDTCAVYREVSTP